MIPFRIRTKFILYIRNSGFRFLFLLIFIIISSFCKAQMLVLPQDSLALVALYNSTGGSQWRYSTNWLQGPVSTWHGISVENQRISKISLTSNNLSGSLPEQIGDLGAIKQLELNSNQISGELPKALGELPFLESLNLSSNRFSASIPPELGELENLRFLYLHYNQLSGSIPPELGQLHNLERLYLLSNQLNDSIPAELGQLKKLTYLYLSNNKLSGSIPSHLGDLDQLYYLNLQNNDLSGKLPEELGKLSKLTYCYLDRNRFSGKIPSSLGQLKSLVYCQLNNNQLSDSIPAELSGMSNLRELHLQMNQLSGSIPPDFGNLTQLQKLNLSINLLEGTIPSTLGSLSKLLELNLSVNQFSNQIPSTFGNLSMLQQLNLERNLLSGAIPKSLNNLEKLSDLSLGSNQLESFEADSLFMLSQLLNINIFFNNLTFEDLEDKMKLNEKFFYYSPQNKIGQSLLVSVDTAANYLLNIECGGSQNSYQWFFGDQALHDPTASSAYLLQNIQFNDLGDYYCKITNPLVPGLILESNLIRIQFKPVGEQAPTDIVLSSQTVDENLPVGSLVGNFSTADNDYNDFHTYRLVSGDGDEDNKHFFIASNQLRTNAVFDYEIKNAYNIRVQSRDNSGASIEKPFSININNISEEQAAMFLSDSTLTENNELGAYIGEFYAGDNIPNANFQYKFAENENTGSDNALFILSGTQLLAKEIFDYEKRSRYLIYIERTSTGGEKLSQWFTIYILDEDEPPAPKILLSDTLISENQSAGTFIGLLSTDGAHNEDEYRYNLSNNTDQTLSNEHFFIAQQKLFSNAIFDYETQGQYLIEIERSNSQNQIHLQTFTIVVLDQEESLSDIFIADGFSPNGDGINDLFVIPALLEIEESAAISIYNRYGSLVYKHDDYGKNQEWWDGLYRTNGNTGTPLEEGAYFVVLSLGSDLVYKKAIYLKK